MAAALSIGCELRHVNPFPYPLTATDFLGYIGAGAIPPAFLCAGVLVFFRARLAYGLGLAASAFSLLWFIQREREQTRVYVSSWAVFNAAWGAGSWTWVLFILSVGLIVVAGVCATLRLFPASWTLRGRPLSQRTWPSVAAGFLTLAVWLCFAGTPYRNPWIVDSMQPDFRILHVEKRGLRFHETAISAYRNGFFLVARTERSLLRYKFETHGARGGIPNQQVEAIRTSPALWKLQTPRAVTLHSWNSEGWYAVRDVRILAFTTENGITPPRLVVDTFSVIDQLPADEKWSETGRDVCLGFCYGPVAAIGFKFANSFPEKR